MNRVVITVQSDVVKMRELTNRICCKKIYEKVIPLFFHNRIGQ